MMDSPNTVRAKTQRRHDQVIRLVNEAIMDVEELAQRLGVSASTVRRDLAYLEQQGAIARTYGGAIPAIPRLAETTFGHSLGLSVHEKEAIAATAASRIQPGESVFLDAGTTCLALAKRLVDLGPRQVIARGLEAALVLADNPEIEVVVTGGIMLPRSHGLVGAMTLFALDHIYVDVAVLGADVIDPVRGLGEPTLEEIAVKGKAVRNADRQLLLADHRKFEPRMTSAWLPLPSSCVVITDHLVDARTLQAWQSHIKVIQSPPPPLSDQGVSAGVLITLDASPGELATQMTTDFNNPPGEPGQMPTLPSDQGADQTPSRATPPIQNLTQTPSRDSIRDSIQDPTQDPRQDRTQYSSSEQTPDLGHDLSVSPHRSSPRSPQRDWVQPA